MKAIHFTVHWYAHLNDVIHQTTTFIPDQAAAVILYDVRLYMGRFVVWCKKADKNHKMRTFMLL